MDVTVQAGRVATGWGQGVCVGDYDNDGWEDLYVTYYGKNRLYHNDHGFFTEVAEKAGVAGSGKAWGTGCAFVDYNRDGLLDLMVANYVDFNPATTPSPGEGSSCVWKGVPVMCGPRGLPGAKNILYKNRGNGTFEDVTTKAHIDQTNGHYAFSVSTFDFDDDGWPDLILANGHVYPEVDKFHLGSEYREPRLLYHNNGNGTFTDVSATAGPGINAVSSARGLAVGDFWNDGQLSVLISNVYAMTSFLVNTAHSGNHWVAFKTVGIRSNRDGIGAKITVKAGKRTLVDEVRSGSSYISQNDLRVHFGLGPTAIIDAVQVRWPSGLIEHFDNLSIDAIHTLKEGSGVAVVTPRNKS